MKTFIKKKSAPQLGFRTPESFRGSKFSQKGIASQGKFNPASFRTQHKGGG